MNKKEEFLEKFGKELIQDVRDVVFEKFIDDINRIGKSKSSIKMHKLLSHFSESQQLTLKKIVLDTIDSTMHYFLWLIEQGDAGDEGVDLVQRTPDETFSLRDVSDGLSGELYTEDGWIERYSKYPPSMTE